MTLEPLVPVAPQGSFFSHRRRRDRRGGMQLKCRRTPIPQPSLIRDAGLQAARARVCRTDTETLPDPLDAHLDVDRVTAT
jgi:hypothetical protein